MNIKQELEKRNLTAYAFAKKAGINRMTVYRWMKGGKISPSYLKVLASYFTING